MPKIHTITLDSSTVTNAVNTISTVITINTFASGLPTEIAFSNDGFTFSSFLPFTIDFHNYDLTDFGGDSTLGRHTVYVKVRDVTLTESLVVTQDIILGEVPIAEVDTLTVRDCFVDIKYAMIDCAPSTNELIIMEYSTTGAFAGEEATATPVSADSTHTGTSVLDGSPVGSPQNFVWDFNNDLGKITSTVFIRTGAANEDRTGDEYIFGPFTVNLQQKPDSGFKMNAGDSKSLKIHYSDKLGASFNPGVVQITEILNPLDTDVLGGAVTLVPTAVGDFEHNYVSAPTDVLGKYVYTFKATVGTIDKFSSFAFDLKSQINANAFSPSTEFNIVVSGDLKDVEGKPIEDIRVYFFPSDIEDNGIKVDSVSDTPIEATTDDCGRFVVELIRNKAYVVVIPILHYRKTIKAPDMEAVELKDLELIDLPIGPTDSFGNPIGAIHDTFPDLVPKPC